MNSLVGYGVSSESDSEGEVKDFRGVINRTAQSPSTETDVRCDKKSRNYLLESASSESEPEEEAPKPSPSLSEATMPSVPAKQALPAPALGFPASQKLPSPLNACSDSSVFANPFKAQADQKLSALQKHVPLTMQAKPSQIGGKRVCVSYRKDGRCRFGIKCKFAHDSDLQIAVTPTDSHPAVSHTTPAQPESFASGSNVPQQEREDGLEGQRLKKRVGLSNTLIPPKRAMKQYTMLRDRERLNMS